MSPEQTTLLVAVVTVGVALAGLMIGLFAWVRRDIERLERRTNERFDQRIGDLHQRVDDLHQRIDGLRAEVGELRERMAHMDGLLDGLRQAIVGRAGRDAAE